MTDLERYTNIGFCQPKYYNRKVWYKATKCMKKLIELGLVEAFNFGRGKGKYRTTASGDLLPFNELYKELEKINFKI